MTRDEQHSSRVPNRPDDESPNRTSATTRLGARHVVMALGILLVASLPFLLMCGQPTAQDDSDPDAVESPLGSSSNPQAADADSTLAPSADPDAPRAYRRVATEEDDGAEPVEPPVFECLPVREDTSVAHDQYPVPLPPFSKDVFPCTRCHDKPDDFNATKRNLTLEHLDIKLVHGPREQWCYGCHNPTDRDVLRLAGGRTVSFLKSYELCGQCHGPKLRDWRLGIHGRRTGCWNGKREYLLCVHCHSPHAPTFKPLTPKPRPKKPTELMLGGQDDGGE